MIIRIGGKKFLLDSIHFGTFLNSFYLFQIVMELDGIDNVKRAKDSY